MSDTTAIPLSNTGYHVSFHLSRRARRKIKTMDVLHVHHPFLSGRQAVSIGKQHNIPVMTRVLAIWRWQMRLSLPRLPRRSGWQRGWL